MTLDIDGAPVTQAVFRSYKASEMAGKPIRITNTGEAPVQAVVSVSGSPVTPEPAASNGFKIERTYQPVFGGAKRQIDEGDWHFANPFRQIGIGRQFALFGC